MDSRLDAGSVLSSVFNSIYLVVCLCWRYNAMSYFKKSCVALLTIVLGVALMLPHFALSASASEGGGSKPRCELASENGIADLCSTVSTDIGNKLGYSQNFLEVSGTGKVIVVNMPWYNDLDVADKQSVMQVTLSAINKSSLIQRDKTKLYNFVCDLDKSTASLVRQLSEDVDPDFARGYSWFKPFSGGVSTFLGFMTIVIFVFLTISILLDIAYLAIPFFRLPVDKFFSKHEDAKPFIISKEAWKAIRSAEADNSSKSAMSYYYRYKIPQFAVVALCLLYLVGGSLFDLIARLIDTFRGVTE